jgi:hypothetical protein
MNGSLTAVLGLVGALCFGLVMGWVTSSCLRRAARNVLTDITTVFGAVGGAAATKLFPLESGGFGAYCIGLAVGFFVYLITATRPNAPDWLGENPETAVRAHAMRANAGRETLPPLK